MTESRYYNTNPDDPDAPRVLDQYRGIKPGDRVACVSAIPLPGIAVVDELIEFGREDEMLGPLVEAVLLVDGQVYETCADNLERVDA